MTQSVSKTVAIIVAHPDDETLWAGGTILSHPSWQCFILCLCRKNDADRSRRFNEALQLLNATGIMADLDDEPDQMPIDTENIEQLIQRQLPPKKFDLMITHNPNGEYTRHLRHEEVSKAVIELWSMGRITADELWTFAYEDGNKTYYPKSSKGATINLVLDEKIWMEKYRIITEIYGFEKDSWEAETTPKVESFWQFQDSLNAEKWLENGGIIIN